MTSSPIKIIEPSYEDLPTYDAFAQLPVKQITGLLDGKAGVQLIEVSPRIVPMGYTQMLTGARF
jgi:hypothetical protein